jgi:hypothetical protein
MKLSKKTNKLFYDRYANKISIYYELAEDFRNASLDQLRNKFRVYAEMLENSKGESLKLGRWNQRTLTHVTLFTGTDLISVLESTVDYSVRVEGGVLSFYSNDDNIIKNISKIPTVKVKYIIMPANKKIKEFLLNNPRKIISKKYTHKFKVTVNPLKDQEESFREWAKKLPKIKISTKSLRGSDGYFYVKDEKTLGLCRLFLSNRIRRIDELTREDEIQ